MICKNCRQPIYNTTSGWDHVYLPTTPHTPRAQWNNPDANPLEDIKQAATNILQQQGFKKPYIDWAQQQCEQHNLTPQQFQQLLKACSLIHPLSQHNIMDIYNHIAPLINTERNSK